MPAHWLTTVLHLRLCASAWTCRSPSPANSWKFFLAGDPIWVTANPDESLGNESCSLSKWWLFDRCVSRSEQGFFFFMLLDLLWTLFLWVIALSICRIIHVPVLLTVQIYGTALDINCGLCCCYWMKSLVKSPNCWIKKNSYLNLSYVPKYVANGSHVLFNKDPSSVQTDSWRSWMQM